MNRRAAALITVVLVYRRWLPNDSTSLVALSTARRSKTSSLSKALLVATGIRASQVFRRVRLGRRQIFSTWASTASTATQNGRIGLEISGSLGWQPTSCDCRIHSE